VVAGLPKSTWNGGTGSPTPALACFERTERLPAATAVPPRKRRRETTDELLDLLDIKKSKLGEKGTKKGKHKGRKLIPKINLLPKNQIAKKLRNF
jgi:hypothetical protein